MNNDIATEAINLSDKIAKATEVSSTILSNAYNTLAALLSKLAMDLNHKHVDAENGKMLGDMCNRFQQLTSQCIYTTSKLFRGLDAGSKESIFTPKEYNDPVIQMQIAEINELGKLIESRYERHEFTPMASNEVIALQKKYQQTAKILKDLGKTVTFSSSFKKKLQEYGMEDVAEFFMNQNRVQISKMYFIIEAAHKRCVY